MKTILCIILLSLFIPQKNFAICIRDTGLVLKAIKGKSTVKYKTGNYLTVFYGENLKFTGKLISVSRSSIMLQTVKKNKSTQEISIADITAVKKIHKKGRKGLLPFFSIMIALAIFGIIIIDNIWAIVVLAGPVISLYTAVPYLIENLLADVLSKKSKKNGWSFF